MVVKWVIPGEGGGQLTLEAAETRVPTRGVRILSLLARSVRKKTEEPRGGRFEERRPSMGRN